MSRAGPGGGRRDRSLGVGPAGGRVLAGGAVSWREGRAWRRGGSCERGVGSGALLRRSGRKMAAEEAVDTQLMLGVGLIGEDASALPRRPARQFCLHLRLGPGRPLFLASPAPTAGWRARPAPCWAWAGESLGPASSARPPAAPLGARRTGRRGGGTSQGLLGPGEEFLPNPSGRRRTRTWRVTKLSRLRGGRCAGNRAGPRAARGPHGGEAAGPGSLRVWGRQAGLSSQPSAAPML